MKKKLILGISFILVFFLGVSSTYLLIWYLPLPSTTETVNKVVNKIEIEETTLEEAIDKAYDAVVVVESKQDSVDVASGTGFVYKVEDDKGYIITNNHVISEGNKADVIFSNGERVEATILGNDTFADIAVLSVPKDKIIKVATIGESESVKLGSTVFAIGAPVGSEYSGTVTKGIVSGKDRLVEISLGGSESNDYLMRVLQTDAAINPGNSGGPLLNLAGEVIGINSLKLVNEQIEGIGFAIPIEAAMEYVGMLEKGEKISRPLLGVQLLDLNETYALFYNDIYLDSDIKEGTVVQGVVKDSAASQAGLKKGDVIVKIGDKKIKNKAELRYELYKYKVGDKLKITYFRDKKTVEVEVTLNGTED